jgi:pathogenesis-related protein 1
MRKRVPLLLGAITVASCTATTDRSFAPTVDDSRDAAASPQDSGSRQDSTDGEAGASLQTLPPAADSSADAAAIASPDAGDSGTDVIEMEASIESTSSDSESGSKNDSDSGLNGNPETGRLAGITAAHNAVRAEVQTSNSLPPLTWSPTLADYAQQWATSLASNASTCAAPQHRPASDLTAVDYGENLATFGGASRGGSAPMDVSTAIQAVGAWAAEAMCWTYGTIGGTEQCNMTCTNMLHSDGCGHYTQIVWRKSTQLGCGVATCQNGSFTQDIWICNYAPAGNIVRQTPY